MARSAAAIELSVVDEAALRGVVRAPSSSQQEALRARIVLRAAEGATNREIAAETGASLPTVGLWRSSFAERGRAGLVDRPRSGRPRTVDDDQVKRVLVKTLEPPPDGTTHWSVRRLAEATGLAPSTVHRIWREHRLKASPDAYLQVLQRPAAGREGDRRCRPLPRATGGGARALRR